MAATTLEPVATMATILGSLDMVCLLTNESRHHTKSGSGTSFPEFVFQNSGNDDPDLPELSLQLDTARDDDDEKNKNDLHDAPCGSGSEVSPVKLIENRYGQRTVARLHMQEYGGDEFSDAVDECQ
jgi:hypothetical protein